MQCGRSGLVGRNPDVLSALTDQPRLTKQAGEKDRPGTITLCQMHRRTGEPTKSGHALHEDPNFTDRRVCLQAVFSHCNIFGGQSPPGSCIPAGARTHDDSRPAGAPPSRFPGFCPERDQKSEGPTLPRMISICGAGPPRLRPGELASALCHFATSPPHGWPASRNHGEGVDVRDQRHRSDPARSQRRIPVFGQCPLACTSRARSTSASSPNFFSFR